MSDEIRATQDVLTFPEETSSTPAGQMPAWDRGEMPEPPAFAFAPSRIVGPGLMMVGGAIGAGEWLMGPAMTAAYGGSLMWIATLSILFQSAYNLEVMRYALYCGEPVFVGYFRSPPGPRFWTVIYLILDFGAIWPYLAANAAVTLVATFLGRPPMDAGPEVMYVRYTSYAVFVMVFVPLIFGGKIYYALERVMVVKIMLVLGYLLFLGFFYVDLSTWIEIFRGFINFGGLPVIDGVQITWSQVLRTPTTGSPAPIDLALLSGFAAIAGVGGLTNATFSNYAREKGWGMGQEVGAIPSIVGGKGITLSHTGKVAPVNEEMLRRWKGWRNVTLRDQFGIWVIGCILGVGIPSLVSYHFVQGQKVTNNNVAAMTAQGIQSATGNSFFLYATLACGFLVLFPSQMSTIDGLIRRWTDAIWTSSPRLRRLDPDKIGYVYYSILLCYMIWGLLMLVVLPQPLTLVKVSGLLLNFALGFWRFTPWSSIARYFPERFARAGSFGSASSGARCSLSPSLFWACRAHFAMSAG